MGPAVRSGIRVGPATRCTRIGRASITLGANVPRSPSTATGRQRAARIHPLVHPRLLPGRRVRADGGNGAHAPGIFGHVVRELQRAGTPRVALGPGLAALAADHVPHEDEDPRGGEVDPLPAEIAGIGPAPPRDPLEPREVHREEGRVHPRDGEMERRRPGRSESVRLAIAGGRGGPRRSRGRSFGRRARGAGAPRRGRCRAPAGRTARGPPPRPSVRPR